MVWILAAGAAVQDIPVAGEIFDGAMLVLLGVTAGPAAVEGCKELWRFMTTIAGGATQRNIDAATDHLARAITLLGVTAVLAWLQRRAVRSSTRGVAAVKESPVTTESGATARRYVKPSTSTEPLKLQSAKTPTAPRDSRVVQPEPPRQSAALPAGSFLKPALPKTVLEPGAAPGPVSPTINTMPEVPADFPIIDQVTVSTFARTPTPEILPEGTKLYRIVGDGNNPAGAYWSREMPATEAEWRSGAAVKGEWNGDGGYVEYTVPAGGLPAWTGPAAPQPAALPGYILKGGGDQVVIPVGSVAPSVPQPTPWSGG